MMLPLLMNQDVIKSFILDNCYLQQDSTNLYKYFMKRFYFTSIFCLIAICNMMAQSLIVKSMSESSIDISASHYDRFDINGVPCALVKVQLAAVGARFEGNIIGDVIYKTGEYWVYMSQGSQMLQIKHPNFLPLKVTFQDYGVKAVQSKVTYELTLVIPQTGQEIDDGMRYLVMTVTPENSIVHVDGQLCQVNNGRVYCRLARGSHSYRVEAVGYAPKEGTVQLTDSKKSITVSLLSVQAMLNVTCPTNGIQVYINEQLQGSAPWQGHLTAGDYLVEGRLQGYRSSRTNIRLKESEQRDLSLPALSPITSSIDVNYQPVDTEVWLDGKKIGTSPDIFRGILVGTHQIELRKHGYDSKTLSVTIEEGITVSVNGNLNPKLQSVTSNSSTSSNRDLGSPTNPTIEYLFTHPMLFLDGSDISLKRLQMEKKLKQLHGLRWRMENNSHDADIVYLRPNGTAPMIDGREIEYMYCSYYKDRMRRFNIEINDKKFSSLSDAKHWVDKLLGKIRAMGFPVKEETKNTILYFTGSNGSMSYEVRFPKDYYNQLYIELSYETIDAIASLNNIVSSTTSLSYNSSPSSSVSLTDNLTIEEIIFHPAATLASNSKYQNADDIVSEMRHKRPSWDSKYVKANNWVVNYLKEATYRGCPVSSSYITFHSSKSDINFYNYFIQRADIYSTVISDIEKLGFTISNREDKEVVFSGNGNIREIRVERNNARVYVVVFL